MSTQAVDLSALVLVRGEDWAGNPTERYARPGMSVTLRGKMGEGFDVRGPHAWVCQECAEVLYVPTAGHVTITAQRHLWAAHEVSVGMRR